MTSATAVFLGPSCSEREARDHLAEADYFPPAARGSFYNIINDGYGTIVLIDGLFYASLSVWHKEIMFALNCGIRVIGSCSMGALRAAELQGTGMIGIGTIFEWYRHGLIDGDDEVALLHEGAEQDFLALTMPLVNLRWNVGRAVEQGLVTGPQGELVIASAKELCFTDRDLPRILEPLRGRVDVPALTAWLERNSEDLKKMDAIRALDLAGEPAATAAGPVPSVLPAYELIHINAGIEYFSAERLTSIRAKAGGGETSLAEYRERLKPPAGDYADYLRARAYQRLIVGWGRELRLEPNDAGWPPESGGWSPELIDASHRRMTGLTLIDIHREGRDAALCRFLQERACSEADAGLLESLDAAIAHQGPDAASEWRRMTKLDGPLIYTLWNVGRQKNVVHGLLAPESAPSSNPMEEGPSETVEAILGFAAEIDRIGPSVFGYVFDPSREILLLHQYLNRLEAA